ncbi:MAG: ATP-binding protein [Ilumatobacteraceae bacterium]
MKSSSVTLPIGDVWRWSGRIDGDEYAPRTARAAVHEACGRKFDAGTVVDIQLVVSELVTNCVEHGHADSVQLCLAGVGDKITVTVASAAPLDGVPHPDDWCLPTATACSGRGLAMVGRIGCAGLRVTDSGDDAWSAITVSIEPRTA